MAQTNLPRFTRYRDNPLLSASDAGPTRDSIMFPCVLRMPSWAATAAAPFYMYFASHSGTEIRAATAAYPDGPWTVLPDPILTIDRTPFPDHISSPHVHIDAGKQRFLLYYHGAYVPVPNLGVERGQPSAVTESTDPNRFTQGSRIIVTRGVNCGYLRVFRYRSWFYAVGRQARLFRSRNGFAWEGGDYLLSWPKFADLRIDFPRKMAESDITGLTRHVAVDLVATRGFMRLYFSQAADDNTEELRGVTISPSGRPSEWHPTHEPEVVLRPTSDLDIGPDGRHDLRDPYLLRYAGKQYLYYSAGAERHICLAVADNEHTG